MFRSLSYCFPIPAEVFGVMQFLGPKFIALEYFYAVENPIAFAVTDRERNAVSQPVAEGNPFSLSALLD